MKGILFKPWKIKAIAESSPDRELQTRRVIKPQPDMGLPEFDGYSHITVGKFHPTKIDKDGEEYPGDEIFGAYTDDGEWGWKARYQVGETVYVKEVHYRYGKWVKNGLTKTRKQRWEFKPLPELRISSIKGVQSFRYYDNPPDGVKPNSYRKEGWYKRSPLFMPEWAARYFITITDVRAERLQEISRDNILAEGIYPFPYHNKTEFKNLWNSINKDYPWESNPWAFAYSFKRVEAEQ